jgi:type II secretory pathway component PulC
VAEVANSPEKHGELADADINGILLGVMIAQKDAFATLKFNGKPEAVYRKGDELGAGYQLVDIEPYRIVVKKNGANKQVLMKKPDNIIETEEVEASVSEAEPEPQEGFALANMFGAVPVSAGGGAGLKLNNLSSEISAMADIRDGDVVLEVDGMSVQDLLADPAQWLSYSTNTSLPVTIMREGQQETIYVNAASLSAKMLPNLGLTR